MEKTLKELIAEMDRIEEAGDETRMLRALSPQEFEEALADKFYEALKELQPSINDMLARAKSRAAARAANQLRDVISNGPTPTPRSANPIDRIENPRSAN